MDEPFLRNLEQDLTNEITYFGLTKNKYSYDKQIFENLNITYCPKCHSKLIYDYYNFETLGYYHCSKCSFKYEEPTYIGKNLCLETQTLNINNEITLIGGDTLYYAYNTLASYALLSLLNIKDISKSINNIFKEPINNYFKSLNKEYHYFNCKSENATTFNQALFKIKNDSGLKDIILGWNIISKRYSYQDISWLYDIEFELLNNKSLNKIYLFGLNKEDLYTRLLLSNIPESKIVILNNLNEIKTEVINDSSEKVYCLSYYEYDKLFNKTFKEE